MLDKNMSRKVQNWPQIDRWIIFIQLKVFCSLRYCTGIQWWIQKIHPSTSTNMRLLVT